VRRCEGICARANPIPRPVVTVTVNRAHGDRHLRRRRSHKSTSVRDRPRALCGAPGARLSTGASPTRVGHIRARCVVPSGAPTTSRIGGRDNWVGTTTSQATMAESRNRGCACRTPASPSSVGADRRGRIGRALGRCRAVGRCRAIGSHRAVGRCRAARTCRADPPFRTSRAGPRPTLFRQPDGLQRRSRRAPRPLPAGDQMRRTLKPPRRTKDQRASCYDHFMFLSRSNFQDRRPRSLGCAPGGGRLCNGVQGR
jgi:hypothetical protein